MQFIGLSWGIVIGNEKNPRLSIENVVGKYHKI
jgi:hypothetical protein